MGGAREHVAPEVASHLGNIINAFSHCARLLCTYDIHAHVVENQTLKYLPAPRGLGIHYECGPWTAEGAGNVIEPKASR
jgi:hypothetical protein